MRVKWWHIALIGACAVLVALPSFEYYFVKLARRSARSVMLLTSLKILREYWPIGTGFGTYGSHSAAVSYSPVYVMYGFNRVYDLSRSNPRAYFDDQFWPIVFGQTGFIGTCAYLVYLRSLYMRVRTITRRSREAFLAAMTCFLYLLISSAAEPAFNNTIAVPLALVMGMAFASSPRYDRAMSGSVDAEAKVEAEAKAEAEVQVDAEAPLDTEAAVDAEGRPARKRRLVWERRMTRKRRPARRRRTSRKRRTTRRRRSA